MKSTRAVAGDRRIFQKLGFSSMKAGLRTKNSLHGKSSLYELFHENTKLGKLRTRAYSTWAADYQRIRQSRGALVGVKVYTLMERHALPRVEARTDLERAIAARRSTRSFSGLPLAVDDLARMLFFGYGRTGALSRAVASGGALYPLELYVAAFNVDGLQPGVYHYGIETGHLDVVRAGDSREALKGVVNFSGIDIDRAALAIVIAAAFQRTTIKYLDRGYRMILMEAGEVAQNFCLLAASMNLGVCLLGGFQDDHLSEILDIDGVEEAPLVAMVAGRLPARCGS